MKKLPMAILVLLMGLNLYAQPEEKITIGHIDKIDSKVLGEEREVWVYVPEGPSNDVFSKPRYPVVYLLDGDGHFFSVVGMIRQLSSINGNTICPKMIVVGIPNTNRIRDLTPIKGKSDDPYGNPAMTAASGGGKNFMAFIEQELMPHIESSYPTAPYRMFIGHSLGGLMVVNAFLYNTKLFNSYVAIDPSMWWGGRQLLNEMKESKIDKKFDGKSFYLGIANTMPPGMQIEQVRPSKNSKTEHIRSILELDDYFKENAGKYLRYKGKYYNEDSHGSVPLISEYDALRFFFSFYRLNLYPPDYIDPNSQILQKIVTHYESVSNEFGYEVKPEEGYINGLARQFLNTKQMKKAEQFFQLNVNNYPKSYHAYDSLGDYYEEAGNKEQAVESYKTALKLNKNATTSKEKLEKLQNK